MTKIASVHNKRTEPMREGDIYVGRGSEWGNPFSTRPSRSFPDLRIVPTEAEAIERYEEWMVDRLYHESALREELASLHGKRLFCFCAPEPCHGDILAELAQTEWWVRDQEEE